MKEQDALVEEAQLKAEEKAKKREEELRTVTKEDDVLGKAGRLLSSNRLALAALDSAVETVEGHIEGVKAFKKQDRDGYTKAMYVFDDVVTDFSSEQWDEDQDTHQKNLDALKGLKEAMEERKESESKPGSDSGGDSVCADESGGDSGGGGDLQNEGQEVGEGHEQTGDGFGESGEDPDNLSTGSGEGTG